MSDRAVQFETGSYCAVQVAWNVQSCPSHRGGGAALLPAQLSLVFECAHS